MDEQQEPPPFPFGEFAEELPPMSFDDLVREFPPISFDEVPQELPPFTFDEVASPDADGPDPTTVLDEVEAPDADGPDQTVLEPEETNTGTITAATIVRRASDYDPQSARLKRLLANLEMNPTRDIKVRQGREVRWIYHTHAEAALITATGSRSQTPCHRCLRGHGPFTECVVIEGEAFGSCGNCHHSMRGNLCSFRKVEAGPGAGRTHDGSSSVAATTDLPGPANPAPAAPTMASAAPANSVPDTAAGSSAAQSSLPFMVFDAHNTMGPGLPPAALPASVATADTAGWSTQRLRRTARALRLMAGNYNSEATNYEALADLYDEKDEEE